jgi:seryl-tRNA synthetase
MSFGLKAAIISTMIDIKHLREHPDEYRHSAKLRGVTVDIDAFLDADRQRVELIGQVDSLRAQLNLKGKPSPDQLAKLQHAKTELEPLQAKLTTLTERCDALGAEIPNLLAEGTPEGGEEANREEKTWGTAEKNPHLQDHLSLAEANGWLDFERGAKVAGSKFYFTKGSLVKLELALVRMLYDLFEERGFTFMQVPHLANARIMAGTGFNPRGDERQIYEVKDTDLNLIATAEIPLTGYHADEIIDPPKLPLLYVGYSPSYRTEGGAYGKYSKGLYRVHQFNKVEMYVFCQPEESEQWHQKLVEIEEQICQQLEIPYRLVRIAAGDLGAPAYKKFDVEYWSPVEGQYRELMSCSNCTDYQARRLNIRTRDADGKPRYLHTLNGTAAAFSRVPIAIMENHQQNDRTIRIPTALQSYYGAAEL